MVYLLVDTRIGAHGLALSCHKTPEGALAKKAELESKLKSEHPDSGRFMVHVLPLVE